MIILEAGINEVVVQQLYTMCSNQVDPYFTWEIKRKGTFDSIVFTQDDSSPIPYYFNTFTLSVGTMSGLTAGVLNIYPGEYTYTIYEMSAPYITNTASAVGAIQNGILIYNATFSSIPTYTASNDDVIRTYRTY